MNDRSVPTGIFIGANFMTPNVIRYGKKFSCGRTLYYELSSGRGLDDQPIFGVTVRDIVGERLDPDLSQVFVSRKAAETYINEGL